MSITKRVPPQQNHLMMNDSGNLQLTKLVMVMQFFVFYQQLMVKNFHGYNIGTMVFKDQVVG